MRHEVSVADSRPLSFRTALAHVDISVSVGSGEKYVGDSAPFPVMCWQVVVDRQSTGGDVGLDGYE